MMDEHTKFTGFPKGALQFFDELSKNNNRQWFEEHKKQYHDLIQQPAQAFVLALGESLKLLSAGIEYDLRKGGVGSILRIYRDIRFSKDKTPYKTNLGIIFWEGARKKMENPSFYFNMDATGAIFYSGFYQFQRDYLRAFRDGVDDPKLGSGLVSLLEEIKGYEGFEVGGDRYKRVPSGFAEDHPRAHLLKHKGLWARSPLIKSDVISSADLVDVCFHYAVKLVALHKWLVNIDKVALR
jgi:uncharacterized protein (TIGR02453 family)